MGHTLKRLAAERKTTEAALLREALEKRGNPTGAAAELEVSRTAILDAMKEHHFVLVTKVIVKR